MHFSTFISLLQSRLKEPLPGWSAQSKMLPVGAKNAQMEKQMEAFLKKYEAEMRQSAVLILLYPKKGTVNFPLMQRYEYEGLHSGQISFPGGKVDPLDRSYIDTALRETEEEFGIDRNTITIIGQLTKHVIPHSKFFIHPIVGYISSVPNFIPDKREVAKIFEVEIDELLNDRIIEQGTFSSSNGFVAEAPFFRFNENYRVWGATSMILNELKVIIKALNISN